MNQNIQIHTACMQEERAEHATKEIKAGQLCDVISSVCMGRYTCYKLLQMILTQSAAN